MSTGLLRHAPTDWVPGRTRVRDEDGRIGTYVGNSEPLPDVKPHGWLGVLIRFTGDDEPLDVDPADLTTVTDPFSGIGPWVPGRYAPGHTYEPWPYQPHSSRWQPVIYYPQDGTPWLLAEPFPAARADGTDQFDQDEAPIAAYVSVLRGGDVPRPYAGDPDDDWAIPGIVRPAGAYDVYVTNQRDLMHAWCEAYALATALNNGTMHTLGLQITDAEILLAAERGDLYGDSRFAGTIHEVRWSQIGQRTRARDIRVPARRVRRLRDDPKPLIEPWVTRKSRPTREGGAAPAGTEWIETRYGLTSHGAAALTLIRSQYDGPTRCRQCGCTADRGCPPDSCTWVEADLCSVCA